MLCFYLKKMKKMRQIFDTKKNNFKLLILHKIELEIYKKYVLLSFKHLLKNTKGVMKMAQKVFLKLEKNKQQNKQKDVIKNVKIESEKNSKIIDLNEYKKERKKSKKLMKLFTAVLLASALISPTKLSADGNDSFVGRDRYETNFKTVQNIQNPEGIIVASGEDFPDSLSAISLVRVTNYPLVLTSKTVLIVILEIMRLRVV